MSVQQKKDRLARIRAQRRRYPVELEGGFIHEGRRYQLLLMPNDTVLFRTLDVHTDEIIEEMNTKKNHLSAEEISFMFERKKSTLLGNKISAYSVYSDDPDAVQFELFAE